MLTHADNNGQEKVIIPLAPAETSNASHLRPGFTDFKQPFDLRAISGWRIEN
jgi:hypothetical protein